MKLKLYRLFVFGLAAIGVVGCSSISSAVENVLPDRKVEYKKAKQAENSLEIPPDLSSSTIRDHYSMPGSSGSGYATYSGFLNRDNAGSGSSQAGSANILVQIDNIETRRNGDKRWLVIRAVPDDIWFKTLGFWQEHGILLAEQDPAVGVMVTDWIENRADIKSDFITDAVRKLFDSAYSAATRDQYRVRLERGDEEGTVELFLTHRGMQEEVVTGATGTKSDRTVWVPRAPDHELEAEMLRRLMVYMGVADERASRSLAKKGSSVKTRSQLVKGRDQVSLQLIESLDRAWRLTGVALDRVGFAVEDRDRAKGVYLVRYNDPMRDQEKKRGLLSKLAFWKSNAKIDKENRYQVSLQSTAGEEKTTIVVLNEQGVRENSDTAVRILTLLHEQLR
jgi:outer membrane protein assembly factor BamC